MIHENLTVLDLKQNNKLTRLRGSDLAELLIELEMSPLLIREILGLPEDTTFGMEIEFTHARRKKIKDGINGASWNVVHDGSCSLYISESLSLGGEVVSPILKDVKKSYSALSDVCNLLRQSGAGTGNKTGGHIHIGSQIIGRSYEALFNFIKTWVAYEQEILRFAYGDKYGARKGMHRFAGSIASRIYPKLGSLKSTYCYDRLLFKARNHMKRGFAVSLDNVERYDEKDTIEFRCPNGTLNPVVWQNNLNFFGKMLTACKDPNFDQDIVDRKLHSMKNEINQDGQINFQNGLDLADLVYNNNEDKVYFLKQYAKFFKQPKRPGQNMKEYSI